MKQLRHLLSKKSHLSPLTSYLLPLTSYLLLISALLLSGCTLSMEEWVETEEQKGYEEVETVENDFYTLKYEYKKTTRSLTDEIQKYIVEIEADTILYFMDNTPSEWLPKQGSCVVSNCCEKFPMGLMGRVLSVEKTGGLIKVVTTDADLEECYEEFDLDLDASIFTSKPGEQNVDTISQSRTTRGGDDEEEEEIVIRDWAMFRAIQSGARQNKFTRTDLEDIYDEDIDKDTTDINEEQIYHITNDDILGKLITSVSGKINTIDITISSINKTHMRKIVKLKEKREYTCTTTSNGIKLSSIMGVDIKKAKTDKDKQSTAAKVAEWLRSPEMFPKVNQKLEPKKKELQVIFEIPLPNLPFGIIIRLKPVFNIDFGIYGDVEAIWWFSSSKTTTDIVNGKKKVDKNEKTTPPANQFAFNAFGNFHVGGGAEAFLGLGKKVGNDAVGVGAFVEMTVDFNLNITPVTVGDYTLGSADEFISITGNGKVGGKILTGGLFGDITFIEEPFKWWDGVVWTYNPRAQFDKSTPVPDSDTNGPYTRHTMRYRYTSLGLNASSMWTNYRKPVLCVYESDNQALDKPTEVLYDKSFSKPIKKDKFYEFVYKNYKDKDFYVIPGVEGPGGKDDITLYPAFKTSVKTDYKPNIEYAIDYDYQTSSYDYVYQDSWRESDETTDTITYRWGLPFTLRNGSNIDIFWDDWGVYNIIHDELGETSYKSRTSLKNRIKSSGKYLVEFNFRASQGKEFEVESGIYYLPKGAESSTSWVKINDWNAREFSYKVYKVSEHFVGDILLKYKTPLDPYGGYGYPEGFKKLKGKFL